MMLALPCAESVQSLGRTSTAALGISEGSLQRNPADADDARAEVRDIRSVTAQKPATGCRVLKSREISISLTSAKSVHSLGRTATDAVGATDI